MTSSEDSADDFESADEDFDISNKSNLKNTVLIKQEAQSLGNNPDYVLQHSKTVDTAAKSIKDLKVSNTNTSRSSKNIESPDFKTGTSELKNTQSILNFGSTPNNLVNDNNVLKHNDAENNLLYNVTQTNPSNTVSDCDQYESLDKEANLKTLNIIVLQNVEQSGSGQQECSKNSSIAKATKSIVDDHKNEPLAIELRNDKTLSAESIIKADDTEVGDGWDFEEDLEVSSLVVDTTKQVVEHADTLKQTVDAKLGEGWGDFEMDNDESFTDNPGDGWDIEEEDGSEIPIRLSKPSDESVLSALEHSNGTKPMESSNSDEQGWGGWGGWGVSSLLSTATGSVTTFSSHVTAGLSSVLETTVGAPDPETLAAATAASDSSPEVLEEKPAANYVGLGSIVSGVSFLGSSVINRGLDTLETLGKKTMEVLQEGDPGLMKKRAMLFPDQDKPVLSQILREAKEKADQSDKEKEEKEVARKVHFESLFDDHNGMVHLEALEMLSTQCDLKLQSLAMSQSGVQLEELQETMSQVRDLCELPEDGEDSEVLSADQFAEELTKCMSGLKISITAAKLIQVNNKVMTRISGLGSESAVVHQATISALAEFTAAAMECFHKSAELLMAKTNHNTPDEADNYVQLTSHLCARVSAIANECTQLLTNNHPIANSSMITNIFLEASNSSSYIRNACQLLVPILQVGAVYT